MSVDPPETKPEMWDVLAMGETLASFEERADGLYARDCGGDASNVAICVARMGGQAAIASRLGTDTFGEEAMALWDQTGVDTTLVHMDQTASTGHRIVPRSGAGSFARRGAAMSRMRPGTLTAAAVARARVLHLSGITLGLSSSARMAAMIATDQAKVGGGLVSFDPVFQAELWEEDDAVSALLSMAALSDVFFPTIADARRLFGTTDPASALDRMLAHGPQVVVLRTAEGAWVASRSGRSFVLADTQTIAHPLAVHDSFVGTFLSGLTAGDDLVTTGARALQAAGLAANLPGEAASIPALEDLVVYPETTISPSAAREHPINAGP